MISISTWFHIKKQRTQLSLKSPAETHSEPQKQLQHSVRVSPSISLYLWPSTNHSFSGPQVPLCQMRGLKVSNLILYSSHCILGYSNMSLSVHVPTGHDWDNGRWQGYTHTRGVHYSCGPVRPELEVAVMADRQRVWDAGVPLPSSWSP